MLRRILALTMALVCACVQPAKAPSAISQRVLAAQINEMAVALVEADKNGDVGAYCSGTWISETRILTAGHCVAREQPILALFDLEPPASPVGTAVFYSVPSDAAAGKMQERKATVESYDEAMDLATLVAKAPPSHRSASLGESPSNGDACALSGSWLGYPFTFMAGLVSNTTMEEGTRSPIPRRTLLVSLPGGPGDSGSGIFNDRGQLIGIVQFSANRGPGVMFGVHRDVIADFI